MVKYLPSLSEMQFQPTVLERMKYYENRYSLIIQYLRGNTFFFVLTKYDIGYEFIIFIFYYVEEPNSIPIFRHCGIKECWISQMPLVCTFIFVSLKLA